MPRGFSGFMRSCFCGRASFFQHPLEFRLCACGVPSAQGFQGGCKLSPLRHWTFRQLAGQCRTGPCRGANLIELQAFLVLHRAHARFGPAHTAD